ncbi:QcrA and Rieske domain-containing protein [Symbiobacterium terraclitae]|uniref:QcrA and Rieske domain-containing protein n=1 Tax=Symbiobacterium terraclitae TaxID=557451 RepID=UPI0035B50F8D
MAAENKVHAAAAAPPTSGPAAEGMTRRQLLRSSMFATIGAMFGLAAAGGGGMFWPIKLSGFGGIVPAPVKAHEMQVGDVVTVRDGKYYLTRSEDGLMALYWKCVHLGCTVPWNAAAGKFMCPCHASVYDITGQNIAGPAPRPLDMMEITVEPDGTVLVNTGKITERVRHEPEHAVKI